jgi:hypothetical protein
MSTETFEYKKDKRFAVSQKLRFNDRFKSDFKFMHATREQAETEAIRLAEKYKRHYYVVEIISVVKFKADAQAERKPRGVCPPKRRRLRDRQIRRSVRFLYSHEPARPQMPRL